MSNLNNKARIDKFISDNPSCKLDQTFPITLKGQKKNLRIYRLPLDYLYYNIRNGRFAAEYRELVKNEGGVLQPEVSQDAEKIKNLLLNLDKNETERTYQDIKIRGQWNCGIITDDGYVIDGNRRMSIISKLYGDTGSDVWKYIDVARLEEPILPEDLWKIEAGIQLGKDEIVRYGPINELLKLREGKNAGLSLKEIVATLYGYDDEYEVEERLDRLKLIEQYLIFIGKPEKYSEAKNKVEHFIDLQSIIQECKKRDYAPDLISGIKKVTFQLINEGIAHLEIRKIRQMIEKNLTEAISEITTAADALKPTKPIEIKPEKQIDTEYEEFTQEQDDEEKETSITEAYFINAKDILDVELNQGKEMLLLSRAEKNLRPLLDYKGKELSTPEAIDAINKIFQYAEELKKKYSK